MPWATTSAASASTRKAVIRSDVAQTNTLRQMHQTNLSSQTQIKHEENIRLYYAVRRQGREPLSPVSKSCGFFTHQSTLTSFLWHVQIRLLPACLPNYSLHISFFGGGVLPSNIHSPSLDWCLWKMTWKNHLFFTAKPHFVVFQAIFGLILAVTTTDWGTDGLLCEVMYSHCTGMFHQPIMFPSSSCWHNRSESQ